MNLEQNVLQVNLDDIIPNRFQPRIAFDEQGLKELSDSIKEHGIIQPLVLRKLGDKYEIIAGERRYKAATLAGLTTVPAVISNVDDNKSAEVALVENIQRRDLTPIEEAKSYKSLLDRGYLTQEELAKKMGISQPAVANKLRLLNLDEEVQQALLAEKISERHARSLLQIENQDEQRKWLNRIINERLTVRQLDQEIKKELEGENEEEDIPTISKAPSIEDIRANAQDINPLDKPKNIDNLMVPENVLTEFSADLPKDLNASPIVMQKEDMEEEVEQVESKSENRFFNFSEEEPANMNMQEMETENVFKKQNIDDLEIIDEPTFVPTMEDKPVMEELSEPKHEVLDTMDTLETSSYTPNPNNKFFTPIMETPDNIEVLNTKEETLVDPMSRISELDGTTEVLKEATRVTSLGDAISRTRQTIEDLKNDGCNIISEELDLPDHYEFIIRIEK